MHILIHSKDITKRIKTIAKHISQDYPGEPPVLICVLKGSIHFYSDLLRELDIDVISTYVKVSSYHGTERGEVTFEIGPDVDLNGRDVIIVEDIVESGNSIDVIKNILEKSSPKSINVCTLLFKPNIFFKNHIIKPRYIGFEIDDRFVIGYGMDYNQMYRNLKHVYVIE